MFINDPKTTKLSPQPAPAPLPQQTLTLPDTIQLSRVVDAQGEAHYTAQLGSHSYDVTAEVQAAVAVEQAALAGGWKNLLKNLQSRKFLLTVLTAGGIAVTWLHGNVQGDVATPVIGGISALYIYIEGKIDQAAAS